MGVVFPHRASGGHDPLGTAAGREEDHEALRGPVLGVAKAVAETRAAEALLQKSEDGIVKVFEADSFVVFRADLERF